MTATTAEANGHGLYFPGRFGVLTTGCAEGTFFTGDGALGGRFLIANLHHPFHASS
jgi:hypothetical protein